MIRTNLTRFVIFAVIVLAYVNIKAQTGWTPQINPLGTGDNAALGKIQFVSANEGWISASNGKLLHTTNGGINWTVVSPEPFDTLFSWNDPAISLSFINPSTGWIIRTKGSFSDWRGAVVYKTTNGGESWNKITIPNYDAGIYIQFVDENNGWIMVFNTNYTGGGLFRTTNGGESWNNIETPISGFPFFINSNLGWLMPINAEGSGTSSDSIRKTTDGGLTWTAPWGTDNAQIRANAIHFSDSNNGWVVGQNGLVMKTSNGGNSWTYYSLYIGLPFGLGFNSKSVFFLDANKGWITTKPDGMSNAYVLYTNNGGSSWMWQPISSDNHSIYSIHFFDALNGGLICGNGLIFHTTSGGITGVEEVNNSTLSGYFLSQNYPNPFNPSTIISYSLPVTSQVSLKVYDVLGNEVATLVNDYKSAGSYYVDFNSINLSSGVYFYSLTAGSFTETKKLILLR